MREQVIELLREQTERGESVTVQYISAKLKTSRNNAARLINELDLEELLIRLTISNDDSYYLKKSLEIKYGIELKQLAFNSKRSLEDTLSKVTKNDFEKLIGNRGSLAEAVEMSKAAIGYPNHSLPLMLYGDTGTGKSYMAQLIHEYAVNNNIISDDAPFVILNCSEYAHNPELLSANLFGHVKGAFTGAETDNIGLLKAANGGILFLDEVHGLHPESQEKLFLFMDKGIFHKIGDNENWETSNVRFVLATTESPDNALLRTFMRRIPITISIPNLEERDISEKAQLIYEIFNNEQLTVGRDIYLSNFVYNILLNHEFIGNVGELSNTIKVCIARAISKQKSKKLEINISHLPDYLFAQRNKSNSIFSENDSSSFSINSLKSGIGRVDLIFDFYEVLIEEVMVNKEKDIINKSIQKFFSAILFETHEFKNYKKEFINKSVTQSIKKTLNKYGIKFHNNTYLVLTKYIEMIEKNAVALSDWYINHELMIEQMVSLVERDLAREFHISKEITGNIAGAIDIKVDVFFEVILSFCINSISDYQIRKKIGLIISHGFSTASSISDAVNDLIGEHVFEAFDMPLDVSVEVIVEEINAFLELNQGYDELAILVDMGSLEKIYKGLTQKNNAKIGIINNITTKLALDIGYGIIAEEPLEKLLEKASSENKFEYVIVDRRERENVIVCSCASGIGTAEKIKGLLDSSLPKNVNIKIMTYDFNTLNSMKDQTEIFEKHNIICVIGTLDPVISDTMFFPIEEFIINNDMNSITSLLSGYMSLDELNQFKVQLLKNFSLNNMMEYLTILNPNKLLEHVASALDRFQAMYDIKMDNSMSVGLYVHICCMVERIVMRNTIETFPEIDEVLKKYPNFVLCLRSSFEEVEEYYGIKIPDEEIGYIYEYIEKIVTN